MNILIFLFLLFNSAAYSASASSSKSCASPVAAIVKFKDGKKAEISRDQVTKAIASSDQLKKQPFEASFNVATKREVVTALLDSFVTDIKGAIVCTPSYKEALRQAMAEFERARVLEEYAQKKCTEAVIEASYQAAKKKFIETNKFSYHISVIPVKSVEEASKVKTALKSGKDFASVASKFGVDPELRQKNGLVARPIPDGMMNPEMHDAVKRLSVNGYTSEPIQVQDTWMFIQLRQKDKAIMPPRDEAMTKEIKKAEQQKIIAQKIHELVKAVSIEAFDIQGAKVDGFNLQADLETALKEAV